MSTVEFSYLPVLTMNSPPKYRLTSGVTAFTPDIRRTSRTVASVMRVTLRPPEPAP